jgi:LysR family transcriptional regulator, transcriptional activator for bauABCD operon
VGPLEASHELFEAADRFCNQAGTIATSLRRVLSLGPVDALVTNAELALPQVIAALRLQNPSVTIDFAIAGRTAPGARGGRGCRRPCRR